MSAPSATDIFLFGSFRLDRRRGVLSRRDERGALVPLAIGSRALDILGVLVERPGELVSRAEIIDAVWPGTIVEDANLNVQIAALRRVLDEGRAESCILTIPGRGYRFVAPVTRSDPETPREAPAPASGVAWASRRRVAHRHRTTIVAVVAVALLVAAGVAAWRPHPPNTAATRVAPHLSIVVLPFASLGDDRGQQYFADGITEDLTTSLSLIPDTFVISAKSALTYRDKPVDTRQVGRELGVRYVLEGSVQSAGGRVRVNAQLIDIGTDAHLWAERFDRDTSDLLALQDEITRRIAGALKVEMTAAEAARPAQNPDALDWVLRGRAALDRPISRENYAEAIGAFERALELDPQSVGAQLGLAQVLLSRVFDFAPQSAPDDVKRAEALADRALAAAPRDPYAHSVKGDVLRAQRRCAEAIAEYETALALDRNASRALSDMGRCRIYIGPIAEAVPLLEQAIRLNPRDPSIATRYFRIGQAHLLQSQIDEAILWLEKARRANEALPYVHGYLVAAYGLKGEAQRAAAELAEAQRLAQGFWQKIDRRRANTPFETPEIRALAEATLYKGLRLAGMPEE